MLYWTSSMTRGKIIIYSFRMSEQKKLNLKKRLQNYGATLEEATLNYLQAVMDKETHRTL